MLRLWRRMLLKTIALALFMAIVVDPGATVFAADLSAGRDVTQPVAAGLAAERMEKIMGELMHALYATEPASRGEDAAVDKGAPLHFSDPGLEIVVRRAVDRPEGPIYAADAAGITELRAAFADIVSLDGIAHLSALQTLDLAYNFISDVTPLAGLTALTSLNLSNNDVADVSPLAQLTNLASLDVSDNRVASLAGLGSLSSLRALDISYNPVRDLTPLGTLTDLELLAASGGRIDDLSPLAALQSLRTVDLRGNRIEDVGPLANLSNLAEVDLRGNVIVELAPLARLAGVQILRLDNNDVVDVRPLAALRRLRVLGLGSNRIEDASPLAGLSGLTWVDLSGNAMRYVAPWLVDGDDVTVYLYGNPIDRASLSAETAERIFGTLRDEHTMGRYTMRFYERDFWDQYGEVWLGDDLMWYAESARVQLPDDDLFALTEPGIDDVTGDGQADLLVVEYTGGAHCCTAVHVMQLEPEFRYVDTIYGLHSDPRFTDIDGDGTVEVILYDWTFAYWKAAFATSPAPRVVLQFDGERFRLAPEHMLAEPPSAAEFASLAMEVRNDAMWETYAKHRGVLVNPPSQLWRVMLDYIYTGHWHLAFQFLDLAWPDDVAGKDVFANAFRRQLAGSMYWPDIRRWQDVVE